MTQFSRVKKYEKLRNEIENEKSISRLAKNTIQQDSVNKEGTYTPVHRKNFTDTIPSEIQSDATFKNEYLDSFIQEVREYNIQKGIREYEDTKLDILQQLNNKNREKRSTYLENINDVVNEEEVSVETNDEPINRNEETMEISRQIFEMLNEDNNVDENISASEEEVVENTEEIIEETTDTIIEEVEVENEEIVENNVEEYEIDDELKENFLAQTRELKAQVESYKEELSEVSDDVNKNNRLLNIIIVILILALLSVCGIVVYWLFKGGII